jgi:hypothetical protein
MSTMEMDPVFTAALREALIATVHAQSSRATSLALARWNGHPPRHNPRGRWRGRGVGSVFSTRRASDYPPRPCRQCNANRNRDG